MTNHIQNPPANTPRLSLRLRQKRGFTLLEMMMVLAIIAILIGTVIKFMVGNVESARDQRVQADIAGITTQLKGYELDNMFLPTTDQGLMALVKEPTTDPKPTRWRQWLKELPMDPWHMPYNYRYPGIHNPDSFDLYSYGPTRKENDKEIGNWDDTKQQ